MSNDVCIQNDALSRKNVSCVVAMKASFITKTFLYKSDKVRTSVNTHRAMA